MVEYNLVLGLVESGAIRDNTELTTFFGAKGLDGRPNSRRIGRFYVKSASKKANTIEFKAFGEGQWLTISNKDIIDIDGMEPLRFAEFHGVKPNGQVKPKGKKRGRKTKANIAQLIAAHEDELMMERISRDDG